MTAALVLPRPGSAAARGDLEFDFARGVPDGVSFRRASPAFAEGQGGLLVMAPPDQPRLARDPASGQPVGLLIEGAATNYARQSCNLADRVWQPKGAAKAVAAPEIAAPDGTKTGGAAQDPEATRRSRHHRLGRPDRCR
ncbi:MAG: hypothetical protein WDN69_16015 [Aliidongia sp.]